MVMDVIQPFKVAKSKFWWQNIDNFIKNINWTCHNADTKWTSSQAHAALYFQFETKFKSYAKLLLI
jgi:hypothetical protein